MHEGPVRILAVDDDVADIKLIQMALKDSRFQIDLNHVTDGEKAMNYLRQTGQYKAVLKPDLILLDLNMPIKDGRQTLEEIRADEALKLIPVVILTTSDSDSDVSKTYSLGANCYVRKPSSFDQFQDIINGILEFWFVIVRLPK